MILRYTAAALLSTALFLSAVGSAANAADNPQTPSSSTSAPAASGPTKSRVVNGALRMGEAEHKAMQGLAQKIVRTERAHKQKASERAAAKTAAQAAGQGPTAATPAAPAAQGPAFQSGAGQ